MPGPTPISSGIFAHHKDFAGFPTDFLGFPAFSYAMLITPNPGNSYFLTLPASAYGGSEGFLGLVFEYASANFQTPVQFFSPRVLVSFNGDTPSPVPNAQFEEVNFLVNPRKIVVRTQSVLVIKNNSSSGDDDVIVNIQVYRSA